VNDQPLVLESVHVKMHPDYLCSVSDSDLCLCCSYLGDKLAVFRLLVQWLLLVLMIAVLVLQNERQRFNNCNGWIYC
jgi:hypothetical protein